MFALVAFDWASSSDDVDLEPETILIIDDDRAILSGLSELLESEGYAVATATDGLDGLNQLRAGLRPSVIVLDLMMPGMDGWDFRHEQLKDLRLKDFPIVILTGAGFSEVSVKVQFGDIDFIAKPAQARALLAIIRRRCDESLR